MFVFVYTVCVRLLTMHEMTKIRVRLVYKKTEEKNREERKMLTPSTTHPCNLISNLV